MVLLSWEPAAPPPCRLYRAPATPPLTLHTNVHISDSLNKVCTYLLRSSGLSWNLEISNQIETLFLETKKYLISSVYYMYWNVSEQCPDTGVGVVSTTVSYWLSPCSLSLHSKQSFLSLTTYCPSALSSELRARLIKLNFSCIWRT